MTSERDDLVLAGPPDAADEVVPADGTPLDASPSDLALGAAERLAVGSSPDVRADDPWPEAGRKLLRFHLARMLAHVPGVLEGDDPEEVHAMRVAARRMRAAWRVFGDGFEGAERRRYLAELRELGSRLGTVRDLDVQLGILADRAADRSARQREGLEPLLGAWLLEREAQRQSLARVLAGEAFSSFLVDYEAFASTPGLAARELPAEAPGIVRHRMPAAIWDAYQTVWAFDPVVGSADLATLHRLRIAAKWLRYTLEFVREPLDPGASALIRPVVALQDRLGDQHDLHVAAELARAGFGTLAKTRQQERAIAKLIAELDEDVARLGRGVGRTWRPIVDPRYRRALGAAIARL
jgi:CHAD domain-containing protein